jgi:hypothetical protein
MGMEIIKIMGFPNQDENKSRPNFPNLNHETRKQEKRHDTFETRIQ